MCKLAGEREVRWASSTSSSSFSREKGTGYMQLECHLRLRRCEVHCKRRTRKLAVRSQ